MQSNKKNNRIRLILLSLGMILFVAPSFFSCDNKNSMVNTTYELAEIEMGISLEKPEESVSYMNFTNKVDGYSISIPESLKVDMSKSSVVAVLENEKLRIEIYDQMFSTSSSVTAESYSDYSNEFLKNEVDHTVTYEAYKKYGEWDVKIVEWHRNQLIHIENDRNYYASVDIMISPSEVMTFLFKSTVPFFVIDDKKTYMLIIESFKMEEITAKPYFATLEKVENKFRNEETNEAYEKYFGATATLTWGIFEEEAPLSFRTLVDIEEALDFEFPIVLYYTGIIEGETAHPKLAPALKNAGAHNRLVELTLQPLPMEDDKGNMVYDILNGKYDEYLMNYVEIVKEYDRPILFRLGNEMNGDWCSYSAYHTSKDTEIYKGLYKFIYKLFKEGGADNVIWVWNPNAKSYPDFKWNDAFCYYPGDEYVDVIGMTNYNTGTYYSDENWMAFYKLYDSLYKHYSSVSNKPLMITEFASSSVGGDKAIWIKNMFEHIGTYDKLKAAVWWSSYDYDEDGNVARPYVLDESEEVLQNFKKGLKKYKDSNVILN